jgi:Virulence activator alpha C-term
MSPTSRCAVGWRDSGRRCFGCGVRCSATAPRAAVRFGRLTVSVHARYVQIRDSHDWSGGDTDFFARAALEHGLRWTRMEAQWASWVIDGLNQRRKR